MSADERIGGVARERLAADLAVRGGRLALEYFHQARVSWKADGSMRTDAAVAVQEALAAAIARDFPDDAVMGEEAGSEAPGPRPALYSWVLDAIGGIDNFGRGLPGFSVSIGVLRNRLPFAGAVYDPIARWLFTACAGRGAWLNDRPLHAPAASLSAESLVSIRTPLEDDGVAEEWRRRHRARRFGSTALHLCYLAMGGLDLVHDHEATLWDVGGAAPIVLEAGAVVTRADGSALFPAAASEVAGGSLPILAGNRLSHRQALGNLASASPVG